MPAEESTTPSPQVLVLWDVDHTLIETRGIGRAIYERIFPAVTGQPLRELATVEGRTELGIIHDTLELHRLDATPDAVGRVAAVLAEGYRSAGAELAHHGRVLPAAREALNLLAQAPTIRQSVLTGNTRDVAQIKLATFGLDSYLILDIGAYGDDHRERSQLVAAARRHTSARTGQPVEPQQGRAHWRHPQRRNRSLRGRRSHHRRRDRKVHPQRPRSRRSQPRLARPACTTRRAGRRPGRHRRRVTASRCASAARVLT